MKTALVTKEWLATKVAADPHRVIGRALAAIYARQTTQEQSGQYTQHDNGVGFSKPDARIGSIGARQFANVKMQGWIVAIWLRPAKDGYPRICKYAAQLNAIAITKAEKEKSRERSSAFDFLREQFDEPVDFARY